MDMSYYNNYNNYNMTPMPLSLPFADDLMSTYGDSQFTFHGQ